MNAQEAKQATIEVRKNLKSLLKDTIDKYIQKNLFNIQKEVNKGYLSTYLEYDVVFDDSTPGGLERFVYKLNGSAYRLNDVGTRIVRNALIEYFEKEGYLLRKTKSEDFSSEQEYSIFLRWS